MDQKMLLPVIGALVVGTFVGYFLKTQTVVQPAPQPSVSPAPVQVSRPHEGFTLHIDAEKHFPGDEKRIAHHYCKQVWGELTECQLFDSDSADARLVGVELVVPADTYNQFNVAERAYWHYHKEEIPKVNAKLPDLSADEAAKVAKSLEETYGKIYLLWDPGKGDEPLGEPSLNILK